MAHWTAHTVEYAGRHATAPALTRELNRLERGGAKVVQVLPLPTVGYLVLARWPAKRTPRSAPQQALLPLHFDAPV